MTSQVLQSLTVLATQVTKDELAIVQPFADAYFDNIVKNPSPQNVAAQSVLLQTEVLANLPNIEAAAAKDVAAALKVILDTELNNLNLLGLGAAGNATVSSAAAVLSTVSTPT